MTEFDQSVKDIIEQENLTGRNESLLNKAFELNNERAKTDRTFRKYTKKWCGGCSAAVFKRLRDYYNNNINVTV